MGAVSMKENSVFVEFVVSVSCYMRALVYNEHMVAGFSQFASDNGARVT
jgi:hypothetical protein